MGVSTMLRSLSCLSRSPISVTQVRWGSAITMNENKELSVPNDPIIPFIEGDGTGPDIWRAAVRVFDAAVEKAYSGSKAIEWKEVYAGEKSFRRSGEWLPLVERGSSPRVRSVCLLASRAILYGCAVACQA